MPLIFLITSLSVWNKFISGENPLCIMQHNAFVDHSVCDPHGVVCTSAVWFAHQQQESNRTCLFVSVSLGVFCPLTLLYKVYVELQYEQQDSTFHGTLTIMQINRKLERIGQMCKHQQHLSHFFN